MGQHDKGEPDAEGARVAVADDWEGAGLVHAHIERELMSMAMEDCCVPSHLSCGYLETLAAQLQPDDFYVPECRVALTAMLAIAKRGLTPDLLLLEPELGKQNHVAVIDVLCLAGHSTDPMNRPRFMELMGIVREAAVRRRLALMNSKATQRTTDHSTTPDDLITQHITALETVRERYCAPIGGADDTVGNVVEEYRHQVDEWRSTPFALRGTTTGIRALDAHTRGAHRGDLWITAARMSMGKTALALTMLLAGARSCLPGHQVAFVSLEMKKKAILHRLAAMLSCQSATDIEDGAPWVDWDAVDQALEELSVLPIRLIDSQGAATKTNGSRGKMPADEIARYARAWNQEARLDALFVDYLELITARPEEARQSRDLQVGGNAIAMKALASELDIPVVLLVQANKETEKRASHVPTLADLRYSDEIGAVADVVLFPINWDYYRVRGQEVPKEAENKPAGVMDIFIGKQRNRGAGMVSAFYLSERMQVVDYNEQRQCPVDYNGNLIVRKLQQRGVV